MAITRRALTIATLAAAASSATNAFAAGTGEPYPYARVGDAAPAFSAPRLGGGAASLADYRDQTLVLAFGGLWCPDCIVEEQELGQLARLVQASPHMAFLAFHNGDRYGRWGARNSSIAAATAAVTAYRSEMNVDYPLAFDLDMAIAQTYGVSWFPTILIIDGDGIVRGSTTDLRRRTVRVFIAEARAVSGGGNG